MYLGIDIGTSSVKVLLMDEQQQSIVTADSPLKVLRPQAGWSEQDPNSWVHATSMGFDAIKSQYPKQFAAIKGISFSGHMHGATLIDKQGEVLRPCILWNDTRSHHEAAELDANPSFRALSGNIVFPGFTAPKLLWVKHNEPEIFAKIHKVLLPKDYVRLWLTGDYASDMSDSAGTSWLDVGKRAWSDELLAASGMDISQMPTLFEGTEATGKLRPELSKRWGINPVIGGGAGDNAASACGMGTVEKGSAFVSLGTSGVLFAANDTYLPNPASAVHTFCHALPNTWHQMGVILSATDSLNWYAKIAGKPAAELTQALGDTLQAPSEVTFLPYLSGERTPHNDASIRGAFLGMSHNSSQQDLTQAVVEGVAFALRDNLAALNASGTELSRITAVGGGSRSHYWLKVIATVLNIPVDIPAAGDFGAAYGAARLALVADTGNDPLAICTPPTIKQTIEPELSLTEAYVEAYERYCKYYPAMKRVDPS